MTINWEVIIWTCITLAVLMSIIGLILYAISAKNVRSKRKELGEVHTELKVGSRIMFAGGVYGKVVSIDDETPSAWRWPPRSSSPSPATQSRAC